MQPYERLKIMRAELEITQSELATSIGLAQSTIGQIEKGTRKLTNRVLSDICRIHGLRKQWFIDGKGDMKEKIPSSTIDTLKKEFNLDDFSYNLINNYLKLSNEQRNSIRDFIYQLIDIEDNTNYVSEAPKTPEELESRFPPIKKSDETKTG